MANYATLKAAIQQVVKTNGNNEITGALLQQSLLAMINSLGGYYQFAGIATPSTNPGTPDQNVFYIASIAGTYANFGGLVLSDGEIAILKYNGAWSKDSTGAASFESVNFLQNRVDGLDNGIERLNSEVLTEQQSIVDVPLTMHTVNGVNGYWGAGQSYGVWQSDNTRRGSEKIDVIAGEKYLVTTKIGGSVVIAYLAQWNGDTWVGVANGFTGGSGDAVDKEYIVPQGVTKIAICSYNTTAPSLKKVTTIEIPTFYKKEEADEKFATKDEIPTVPEKYGVKWSVSDVNDLGTREFMAVGKVATIGIGGTNGASDFDSIYPWSGMKRCNIKTNANGASVVTFEGETGFALDGSNGDVFVCIPKFKTDHFVKDGYEHIVIGDGYVHPAFIEDGEELDEIFIGAFEASGDSSALFSRGGVIPANNITGASFLAGAKARGTKYSLYDMRCVDALWRLMAVEYGCRNSNRIFGWGYANYMQPDNLSHLKVVVAAQNTNTITLAQPTLNSIRVELLQVFASGNNLCICENTQENIIAQRKIVSVECASLADNVVITFEGDQIDVNTDMFVGNAPCDCNYCETIGDSWKLNWHTGRANRPVLLGIGYVAETCNPCRYRWVENPVGNVWHSLPDVTFKDLQMYVCKNMKDYEMLRYTPPYNPVGAILPEQNSNGTKLDVNTSAQPNYWITSLLLDIFAKGNNFGKSFDTVHNGTITSTKGYGGYYYLYSGGPFYIANGGGYDHLWRSNMLTNRAWQRENVRWYLYGARLMFKNI